MTVKELSQYYDLCREIEKLERERMKLHAISTNLTPTNDGMPRGSGVSDPTGVGGSALADISTIINERQAECAVKLLRVRKFY